MIDATQLMKSLGKKMEIDETETVSYPEDGLVLDSPVRVKGELTNTGPTIMFRGSVSTRARMNCARCLKEFDLPVEFDIEEEYGKGPQREREKREVELTTKDFIFEVGPDNTIDLSEAIRQDIITELPIKPLCDEKCPDAEIGTSEGGS